MSRFVRLFFQSDTTRHDAVSNFGVRTFNISKRVPFWPPQSVFIGRGGSTPRRIPSAPGAICSRPAPDAPGAVPAAVPRAPERDRPSRAGLAGLPARPVRYPRRPNPALTVQRPGTTDPPPAYLRRRPHPPCGRALPGLSRTGAQGVGRRGVPAVLAGPAAPNCIRGPPLLGPAPHGVAPKGISSCPRNLTRAPLSTGPNGNKKRRVDAHRQTPYSPPPCTPSTRQEHPPITL
jgi:hypothetical protein